jgi:hypothetical protein
MIELDSNAMEEVPIGTYEKINKFTVWREIWETVEKTA